MKKFFENKMTRRAAKIAALFFAASLALFSCDNFSSSDFSSGGGTRAVPDASKAYVKIAGVQTKETAGTSKTVLPNPLTVDDFTDWTLKREVPNEGPVAIASADSLAELTAYAIEVQNPDPERDYFILEAKKGTVTFSSSASARLTPGVAAELSFTLMPTSGDGSFLVKVNFTGNAAAADWTLSTAAGAAQSGEAEFTKTASGGTAVAKADVNVLGPEYPTYTLDINFYGDEAKTIPLNTYSELVRIVPGYQSGAERDIDLNALYKITYHNLPESYTIEGGGTLPLNYSRKSGDASGVIQISNVAASGKYFAGWYTSADFAPTSRASQILPTTASDVNLYGLFTDELYVSNSGSSSAVGTKDDPLGSIADAASIIQSAADSTINWKIMIDGILTGPQTLEELSGGAGMAAASITLKGVKGPSGGVFQDGINAGWDGTTVPETTIGSALKIKIPTAIPITMQDLLIKGGYATNGGGIYLSKGYVTFESGMITTNKATTNGGGVFICYDGFAIFEMKDVSIAGNHAGTSGGGVYIYARGIMGAGTFAMSGGTVSGNSAAESGTGPGYGHGVYVAPPDSKNRVTPYFGMSGSALVASDNDVYLAMSSLGDEAVITVAGALTGEAPVATITGVEDATSGGYKNSTVLAAQGSGSVLKSYKKFAVNPAPDGTVYYVDPDGRLTTTQPQTFDLYVQQDASGSGTSASSPFGSIEEAANYIATNGNSGTVASIKIIGNLSGAQVLSGFNDSKAKQIVIEGANGVDATSGTPLDALTGGSGVEKTLTVNLEDVSVEITNLRISGASKTGLYVGDLNNAYTNVLLSEGTLITQNGTGSGDYNGGGVYITESSFVETLDGCSITNNKAGANGGGVYCQGRLSLFGGTISNNQAVKGTGIYVDSNGALGMMGSGSVSSGNDIYLVNPDVSTYGGIAILGTLTAQAPVAVITPHVYENGTQLLETYGMSGAPTPDISVESQKFAVAQPSGSSITWSINTNGMLSDGSTTVSFYVAQNGSSSAAGSRGDPFDSLSDALDYIADNDYSGYDVIVKVDGLLPVSDHEAQHTVYISSFSGNSLTIEGANGLENGIPQDSISGDLQIYFDNYVLSEITFRNICLTGSSSGNYIGGGDGEIGYYRTNVIFDSGVLITGNSAEYAGQGAAFTIKEYSSVTMKDGCEISGNYNTGYGSDGVYIDSDGTFNMEGGTIKDNKESGDTSGTGVTVEGTFNISGGAVVASNNIVSLYSQYTNVTIADDLTADGIVATIGPATSGETGMYVTPAVLLSEAKSGLISAYHNKFAVLPKSGMNWAVDDKGNLVPAGSGGGGTSGNVVNLYVNSLSGYGSDSNNGLSEDSALMTLGAAFDKMTDSTKDYVVNVMSKIWQDGLTSDYSQLEISSGVMANSIKITGTNTDSDERVITGQYDYEGPGTVMKVTSSVPVTIESITITGGCSDSDHKGGCIEIGSGATVILGNDTYIQGGKVNGGFGGGVYVSADSTFIMKGNSVVQADQYSAVYLEEGAKIMIGSNLTGRTSDSIPYVAQITPASYSSTTAKIGIVSDSGTSLAAEYNKFAVTPITKIVGSQIVDVNYTVNESGMLQEVSSGGGGTGGIVVTSNAGGSGIATILSSNEPVSITISNDDETIDFTKLIIKVGSTEYASDSLRNFVTTGTTDNENSYEFSFSSSLTSSGTVIEIYYDGAVIGTLNVMRNGNAG